MAAISRCIVTLSFHGRELDVAAISAALGCQPTSTTLKSALLGWHLESDASPESELEQHIASILDQLTDDLAVWRDITARYRSRVFCGLFMADSNEGFALSPSLLQRLSERGLRLECDIYASDACFGAAH